MESFFEHSCYKCGIVDESKFNYAGPHIKQVCNNCGFYVKFFDKAKIPDINEIKLRIWYITKQDTGLIAECKKDVMFIENLSGLDGKMMYWKLYLKTRERILKNT